MDNGIASVIYNQAGEIRKAIACGERSLEIIKTLEDQSKIVFVLGNLIFQYQQVGEFEQALAAYDALLASGEGERTRMDCVLPRQMLSSSTMNGVWKRK